MTSRIVWALFAVLAVAFAAPSLGRATTRLGESPHNKPGACSSCHEPGAPGAVRPIVPNCLSCHPDADMHPVGMAPREIKVAVGWPLEDGKVTCATCHAEPSCDPGREKVAPWFRGGNPDRTMDFCYRCHTPTAMQRTNPHTPATAGGRTGCAACHSGEPPKGAALAQARLRLDPAATCATCHTGPVHAGAIEHVGKVQRTPITGEAAALLPLGEGGTIQCWTCHDVHAPGTDTPAPTSGIAARISAAREVPAAAPKTARPPMLALPANEGSLCKACHGKGP